MADASSWRFWSRGAAPGALVCGVVRDSVDRLGRPYPLLVLGTGSLPDWEERWDLLPYACLAVWERIEYLGAQRYEEIGRFESAIRGLHPPIAEWADFSGRRDREGAASDQEGDAAVSEGGFRFFRIDGGPARNLFSAAVDWQSRLRRDGAETPNAVFFGGTLAKAYLGVFCRPLSTPDFSRIWNVTAAEDRSTERGTD